MAATQLVPLPAIERLSKAVTRILGGNPGKFTLQGTNTYLLTPAANSHRRILVDTGGGLPIWTDQLRTVLEADRATVSICLLTHWHGDHVGGVSALRRLCPDVRIFKRMPEERSESTKGETGWEDIEDGQVFELDGMRVRAIATPGHSLDHVVFVLESGGKKQEREEVILGDCVLGHGTAVFEDLTSYLASLRKLHQLGPLRGYPGHGAVVENTQVKVSEYLRHRQQREDEMLQLVINHTLKTQDKKGESPKNLTVEHIVSTVYPNLPKEVTLWATHGVLQVLNKLEDDGKIKQDLNGGYWFNDRSNL